MLSRSTSVLCLAAATAVLWSAGCQQQPQTHTPTSKPSAGGDSSPKSPEPKAPPLQSFTQEIPGTKIKFDMVALPAGEFVMGSPGTEKGRNADEGPQHKVTISPIWMAKCEVRWDEYDLWSKTQGDVDGVTRPTPPYVEMTFGMGRENYPAICMTQLAAATYCEWLTKVTGRHYRLPTEAEWEYACRAGTDTAYSFGDDPGKLDEYAWHEGNADEEYHEVGSLKPNPWGLHDMHGNVAEWCQDQYKPYAEAAATNPMIAPTELYPRATRGGHWQATPEQCRSSRRLPSHEDWKEQDPQVPKSIWYHTDADFVGFRVVCDPTPPKPAQKKGP